MASGPTTAAAAGSRGQQDAGASAGETGGGGSGAAGSKDQDSLDSSSGLPQANGSSGGPSGGTEATPGQEGGQAVVQAGVQAGEHVGSGLLLSPGDTVSLLLAAVPQLAAPHRQPQLVGSLHEQPQPLGMLRVRWRRAGRRRQPDSQMQLLASQLQQPQGEEQQQQQHRPGQAVPGAVAPPEEVRAMQAEVAAAVLFRGQEHPCLFAHFERVSGR
jgi:hypothetical protein